MVIDYISEPPRDFHFICSTFSFELATLHHSLIYLFTLKEKKRETATMENSGLRALGE